jgi:galactonate dehydratase
MRITALKTFLVPPRWLFLEVETDAGISGWGEPVLEGHAEALAAKVREWGDVLVGRGPRLVEDTWQMLYRNGCYRGGPALMSALAGVGTALWDIKARAFGVPIHELLGGPVRDRVRSCAWIPGDRPLNLAEGAEALIAAGFDACMFNVCGEMQVVDTCAKVDEVIRRLVALREAVGARMDLAFGFHGRVHLPMARVLLREIEPLRPILVEDAAAAGAVEEAERLSRLTSSPLRFGDGSTGGDVGSYTRPGGGFDLVEGCLTIPTGAGPGIEVDEAAVEAAAQVGHRWRAPVWRHRDGSAAEW